MARVLEHQPNGQIDWSEMLRQAEADLSKNRDLINGAAPSGTAGHETHVRHGRESSPRRSAALDLGVTAVEAPRH